MPNTVREIGQRLNPEKRARQYIRHIRLTERTKERFGTHPAPWAWRATGDATRHVRSRPTGPVVTSQGVRTGHYRLLTTLTNPAAHPARELMRLYRERWEIETAYAELKSTILGGRVLRAHTPAGIEQEVWALLVTYQALLTAMADATDSVAGTPTRTGPASPSPCPPPTTSSSWPRASSPTP